MNVIVTLNLDDVVMQVEARWGKQQTNRGAHWGLWRDARDTRACLRRHDRRPLLERIGTLRNHDDDDDDDGENLRT